MSTHWTTRYIGLPYVAGGRSEKGVDCWGLLRLIYARELKIGLPVLPGIAMDTMVAISHEIQAQSQGSWREQPIPTEMCAVAMSQKTALHHVGVWTDADGGKILHQWKGPVCADTIRSVKQKGIRTILFFKYVMDHRNA